MMVDVIVSEESGNKNQSKGGSSVKFANRTRYVVLILAIATLTMVYSNSLAFNFTYICMKKEAPASLAQTDNRSSSSNVTTEVLEVDMFTNVERSILFAAAALGTLIGSFPITYLVAHFGFRKMFVAYGMLSAGATLLTPFAVSVGVPLFVVVRVVQGIALSTSFVSMGAISAEWSPLKSSGMYISFISCHIQFGSMFTMPVAGALCASVGWPSVYYLQGALSAFLFIMFFYFYRDSPRFQRHVSEKELTKIEVGKVGIRENKGEVQQIPYRAILCDRVVWGVLSTTAGGIVGIFTLMQFGPIYLNKVLGLDIQSTGNAAAIPFALSVLLKIVAGPLSDRIRFLSEKSKVITFSSISQFAMAGCYLLITILPMEFRTVIQVMYTMVVVFSGLAAVGSVKGTHLATQQYCHVIMAWCGMISSVINLILPPIVGWVAPDNTAAQWNRLFIGISVIIVVTNAVFLLTIDVEPREWTKTLQDGGEKASNGKKNNNNNLLRHKVYTIADGTAEKRGAFEA